MYINYIFSKFLSFSLFQNRKSRFHRYLKGNLKGWREHQSSLALGIDQVSLVQNLHMTCAMPNLTRTMSRIILCVKLFFGDFPDVPVSASFGLLYIPNN